MENNTLEKSMDREETVQELCEILELVPIDVWKKMGYEKYNEVEIRKIDNLHSQTLRNIADVTIILRGERDVLHIEGIGLRNYFRKLAKYYKPYNDFCIRVYQWHLMVLQSQLEEYCE